jgi:hypothetical protein
MKMTVTESVFVDHFKSIRPDNFTRTALAAMFDYFEEIDPDMELDVIAICCDYSEYSSAVEAATEYGWDKPEDVTDEDDLNEAALEWLNERTSVIDMDGDGVVIAGF